MKKYISILLLASILSLAAYLTYTVYCCPVLITPDLGSGQDLVFWRKSHLKKDYQNAIFTLTVQYHNKSTTPLNLNANQLKLIYQKENHPPILIPLYQLKSTAPVLIPPDTIHILELPFWLEQHQLVLGSLTLEVNGNQWTIKPKELNFWENLEKKPDIIWSGRHPSPSYLNPL
jgi:hypothetical protein